MNAWLDSTVWWPVPGLLALEVTVLVGVALVFQKFIRSAAWRRTLWQATFVGLACVFVAVVFGANRVAWFGPTQATRQDTAQGVVFETTIEAMPDLARFAASAKEERLDSSVSPGSRATVVPALALWLGWSWLAGSIVIGAWMGTARLMFLLFVRRNPLRDEALLARADALVRRIGLGRRVAVSETPGLAGPIAFGIFRPGISLPEGFARRFSVNQQEAMLAHELAHLAARDPLWHALADTWAALLWWHPLVWVARRQLRAASESAADEASLLVENGPAALAECLVELGGRLNPARSLAWLGMEGGEFRSGLGRRVKRLVTLPTHPWKPVRTSTRWLVRTLGVTAAIVVTLAATAWLQPHEARADSFSQAFRESVIGLALIAAMPAPQADAPAVPAVAAGEPLHTRWFKIDPTSEMFIEAMHGWLGTNAVSSRTNRAVEVAMSDLRRIFDLAGVDLTRPKSILFNERLGQLMVRATLQDLDIVEQLIQVLNAPLPQVTVEVMICEMPEGATRALGLDWFPVRVSSNAIPRPPGSTGILTDPQYRVVQRALAQRTDVKVTELPKVTTLSGRQAQVKRVQVRYVVTRVDSATNEVAAAAGTNSAGAGQPVAEPFELGPVVDIVPVIRPDGNTITMTIKASLREFEGYDLEGGTQIVTTADGRKEIVKSSDPRPIFRKRELVSDAVVWDGQTMVLFDGTDGQVETPGTKLPLLGDLPVMGRLFRDAKERTGRTNLIILVTPTLIDPAGNKIHP